MVGEAYRVDQDKVAGVRFDPGDKTTWGQGGTARLLIDPCTADATHGAVFAGTGGFKTTAITVPTLAHWTGSAVVLDPSCQVGPMTAGIRETMGHKVVMVGPGLDGFNVLDAIDPRDPLAETHVQAVIEHVAGETRANQAGENAMFRVRGKELLTCLLADLLWDSAIPAERKTLREFRQRVRTPEKKMRGLLADIHADSKSQLARELAGSLMDVVSETFSGIYSNAVADTQWLSIKAYADMLSGGSFRSAELAGGELTVFVQIPMDALRATPETARVVIGSLLSAVYRAEGQRAWPGAVPARRGQLPRPDEGARGRPRRGAQIRHHPRGDVAEPRPAHGDLGPGQQERVVQRLLVAAVRRGGRRGDRRGDLEDGRALHRPGPHRGDVQRHAKRPVVGLAQPGHQRGPVRAGPRPDPARRGADTACAPTRRSSSAAARRRCVAAGPFISAAPN